VLLCACAALAACAGPRIRVDSIPAPATLYVNGHVAGRTPKRMLAPYYGGYRLEAQLDRPEPSGARNADATVELAEPVTPWIFPLDFLVEALLAPFSDRELQVSLPLLRNEDALAPAQGGQDALLERARSLAVSR
jgi:hypothetical protein